MDKVPVDFVRVEIARDAEKFEGFKQRKECLIPVYISLSEHRQAAMHGQGGESEEYMLQALC